MTFDPDELNGMRDAVLGTMPEQVDVMRPGVRSADEVGTYTEATDTVVASVPARFGQYGLRPNERELAGRLGVDQAVKVTVPYDTDVAATDRVRQADGTVWEVAAVLPGGSYPVERVLVVGKL